MIGISYAKLAEILDRNELTNKYDCFIKLQDLKLYI